MISFIIIRDLINSFILQWVCLSYFFFLKILLVPGKSSGCCYIIMIYDYKPVFLIDRRVMLCALSPGCRGGILVAVLNVKFSAAHCTLYYRCAAVKIESQVEHATHDKPFLFQ